METMARVGKNCNKQVFGEFRLQASEGAQYRCMGTKVNLLAFDRIYKMFQDSSCNPENLVNPV